MSVSPIRTNSLAAFAFTVIVAAFYLIVFLALVSLKSEHAVSPDIAEHLSFVWTPFILSGAFYFWASQNMPLSFSKRLIQVLACAILAPTIGGSIIFFFGFVILGWKM